MFLNQPQNFIFDPSGIQQQEQQQQQHQAEQQLQDTSKVMTARDPHANSPLVKHEHICFAQSATPAGMQTLIDNPQTSTLAAHGAALSGPHKQSGNDSNLEYQIGL